MTEERRYCIISPFFFPEEISTGKYNTWLAKALVRHNINVEVWSSVPIYPNWVPMRTNEILEGVNIKRGGGWLRYPKSALLRRAILELWFSFFITTCYMRLKKTPSHLVAVFPPSLFFFFLTFVISGTAKKIGIIHDLQGVYASHAKGILGRMIHRAIHSVERKSFTSCDRLVFLSKSMAMRAINEYSLDEKKCAVCYPFVALPEISAGQGSKLAELFDGRKINVVYSGALGDKQNPDALLSFFTALSASRSDITCHIFSAGPHFERLRNSSAAQGYVRFHDLVAGDLVLELYARSDVQVIPQADGTSDGSLPSKLPNLMASGVPVFVICEKGSELAELVVEADAGVVSNSWDSSILVNEFVASLPLMTEEPRQRRIERLRCFVSEKFSLERVLEEINKV